jgi:hypothetical protein
MVYRTTAKLKRPAIIENASQDGLEIIVKTIVIMSKLKNDNFAYY